MSLGIKQAIKSYIEFEKAQLALRKLLPLKTKKKDIYELATIAATLGYKPGDLAALRRGELCVQPPALLKAKDPKPEPIGPKSLSLSCHQCNTSWEHYCGDRTEQGSDNQRESSGKNPDQ